VRTTTGLARPNRHTIIPILFALSVALIAFHGAHAQEEEAPDAPVRPVVEDEGEMDEEEQGTLFKRFGFGLEADLEFIYEEEGNTDTNEFTFDEVTLTFDSEWLRAEASIKYETEGKKGVIVEEAWARLGGNAVCPWFVQAGRTVLPFGEYESLFIDDPLVAVVGETDEDSIVLGYENDWAEVALGAFETDLPESGNVEFAAGAKVSIVEYLTAGVSWSSSLGESVELRDIHREYAWEQAQEALAEEDEDAEDEPQEIVPPPVPDTVGGLAFFATLDLESVFVHAEYVSALESFVPEHLDDMKCRPRAWNLEFAVRPLERWTVATRYESASELPETPETQYGVAISYELCGYATATTDFLHAEYGGGAPDCELVGVKLELEY